jgi:hypothetical protein
LNSEAFLVLVPDSLDLIKELLVECEPVSIGKNNSLMVLWVADWLNRLL